MYLLGTKRITVKLMELKYSEEFCPYMNSKSVFPCRQIKNISFFHLFITKYSLNMLVVFNNKYTYTISDGCCFACGMYFSTCFITLFAYKKTTRGQRYSYSVGPLGVSRCESLLYLPIWRCSTRR